MIGAARKISSSQAFDANIITSDTIVTCTQGFKDLSTTYRGFFDVLGVLGSVDKDLPGDIRDIVFLRLALAVSGGGAGTFQVILEGHYPQNLFDNCIPQGTITPYSQLDTATASFYLYNSGLNTTTWTWTGFSPSAGPAATWDGTGNVTCTFYK